MDVGKLKGQIPDSVYNEIQSVIDTFTINTPMRLSHFLGQCAHESGNFKFNTENLNYSSKGLITVFPKYFKQPGLAEAYARNPERIASRVYANRMGNGSEGSGDGWKFRGRGYIQLTGKNNYSVFDTVVKEDIISNPDLVSKKYPLLSAAWFFNKNKLNSISDKGLNETVITELTKRINGGTNGLQDRIKYTIKFGKILGVILNG
jgi:putative chitinase